MYLIHSTFLISALCLGGFNLEGFLKAVCFLPSGVCEVCRIAFVARFGNR